jgi:hypothetical protein
MADPQVNPNALGAPTEGFGQTVTFAFDPRGVTPSLEVAKSTPAGFNVSGVSHKEGMAPVPSAAPPRDGTADLLMRVGAEILAPKLEEQRNAKFVEGVQRAMQGEAAKDIANQQPWYSRIFGDTPAVAGARAYEVQAKVNEIVSKQTANMDAIKGLDPDAAAKHFSGLINQQMTGDPATDQHVAKAMLDQLPMLMKSQAKAYHGYVQQRAAKALSTNMATAGEALQQYGQSLAEDTISPEDMAVQKRAFIASILPPEGINEETYGKTLAANIRAAADKGQFHVIAAIKESGGWDALTPEQQNVATAAVNSAATKFRDQYAFRYAREIAELKSDAAHLPAGMTPKDISDRFTKMNTAYQKLSGSPVGLFSSDEMATGVAGAFNYLKAEEVRAAAHQATLADKNAKAADKALAAAELDASVNRLIASGDVGVAKVITKATDDQVNIAAYKAFTDKDNPQVATDLLRNNFVKRGYVNPILKEEYRGLLRSSEGRDAPTDDFFMAADRYKTLASGAGGTALADAMFGDYAPRLAKFLRMTGGNYMNPNVADAFMASMDRSGDAKPQPLNAKARTSLAKDIAKSVDPFMPAWLGGGVHLREDTADALATMAENNIEDWRAVGGVSDAEAVKRGIAGALAGGQVEIVGGFAVRRGTTGATKSLRELAGSAPDGKVQAIPEGAEDKYFERFLSSKLKAEGVDLGGTSVAIHHLGAAGGAERYSVAVAKDGNTVLRSFTSAEWQRFAGEQSKQDTMPVQKLPWAVGPYVDYSVPGVTRALDNMPSPYADATKWAAYRAEQRRKAQLK